jgi:hypothetical protein
LAIDSIEIRTAGLGKTNVPSVVGAELPTPSVDDCIVDRREEAKVNAKHVGWTLVPAVQEEIEEVKIIGNRSEAFVENVFVRIGARVATSIYEVVIWSWSDQFAKLGVIPSLKAAATCNLDHPSFGAC